MFHSLLGEKLSLSHQINEKKFSTSDDEKKKKKKIYQSLIYNFGVYNLDILMRCILKTYLHKVCI